MISLYRITNCFSKIFFDSLHIVYTKYNKTGTAASKDSSLFTISGAEEVLTRLVVMKEKQQQTADDERIVKEAKKRGRVGSNHHFID